MEQIIPSIRFNTFNLSQILVEPARTLTAQRIDQMISVTLPGLSYALDQENYLQRVGYHFPFNPSQPPQLYSLPKTPGSIAIFTGKAISANERTSDMNSIFSSSARQFYDARPKLLIPELIIHTLNTPMNLPPSGVFDSSDYLELPVCLFQSGAWNLGDRVIYFRETPPSSPLSSSLISVLNDIQSAIQLLPESRYQTISGPTSSLLPGQVAVDLTKTLSFIDQLLTSGQKRLQVFTYLRTSDRTKPETLKNLLAL